MGNVYINQNDVAGNAGDTALVSNVKAGVVLPGLISHSHPTLPIPVTYGGDITISQKEGNGDSATISNSTAVGNVYITQYDVASNALGDTVNVIGTTAGFTIQRTPYVFDVYGKVIIKQGNAPGDVALLNGDHINDVAITQGDNVQVLDGSTVASDVAEINGTTVTSDISISQGIGTSTGNYVAAIGFDYLGYIKGTPASSSVTAGGDTYIHQNYANNQVYLGDAGSSFTTVNLDVFTGPRGGAFVMATNTTVYFGSLIFRHLHHRRRRARQYLRRRRRQQRSHRQP